MSFLEKKLGIFLIVLQAVFILLFGIFARYADDVDAKLAGDEKDNSFHPRYPVFQDVHIMIFVGFGFLMTFLKKYGYSSVGFNFLLASLALQWSIIVQGLIAMRDSGESKFPVDVKNMIAGDFAAASVLISMGVVLGKTSPLQLTVMAIIEIVFYSVNVQLGETLLGAADAGGSMFIHTFGAYFGLTLSFVIKKQWFRGSSNEGAVYHSDLFAMIGTVFLWMCWPSFNGGLLTTGDQQHRAAINTYFSLAACVLATFGTSILVSKGKLNMVHVQNATLAGGVAIGTMANYMVYPFGSMIMGFLSGVVSVLGYQYLTPLMASKLGLHDTCGVHNLHGMPGIMAALAGIVAAGAANAEVYGRGLSGTFHHREDHAVVDHPLTTEEPHHGRTAAEQAGIQAAALGITLGLAILGGAVTGVILRFVKFLDPVPVGDLYQDAPFWVLEEGEEHEEEGKGEELKAIQKREAEPSKGEDGQKLKV